MIYIIYDRQEQLHRVEADNFQRDGDYVTFYKYTDLGNNMGRLDEVAVFHRPNAVIKSQEEE